MITSTTFSGSTFTSLTWRQHGNGAIRIFLSGSPWTRPSHSGNSRERISVCVSVSFIPPPLSRPQSLSRLSGSYVDRQSRNPEEDFRYRSRTRTSVGHHQRVRASFSLLMMAAWFDVNLVIRHGDLAAVEKLVLMKTGLPFFTSSGLMLQLFVVMTRRCVCA